MKKIFAPFLGICLLLILGGQSLFSASLGYNSGAEISTISSEWKVSPDIAKTQRNDKKTLSFSDPEFFLSLKKPIRLGLFYDDPSLYRFVSRDRPLNSRLYRPENLIAIAGEHIDEAGRIGYIRGDIKGALLELAAAFEEHFHTPLIVISGYRSAEYQQRLWDIGMCHNTLCAPPGYSEHQLGLAVDLFDASTEGDFVSNRNYASYVAWMKKYAHLYGWTQSYQKGAELDGYEVEPWHWRYLGKDMATKLKRLGWTYTEYVKFQESIERRSYLQ